MVEVTDYDLDTIAALLNTVEPPLAGPDRVSVRGLKEIARAWMGDMQEYCNVSHSLSSLDPAQTGFMRALRAFRLDNPWLRRNFGPDDVFDYLEPIDGRTLFRAYRRGPDGREIFALCHMEGKPTAEFGPLSLLPDGVAADGWQLLLRTPGIGDDTGGTIVLRDSMGLLFTRG